MRRTAILIFGAVALHPSNGAGQEGRAETRVSDFEAMKRLVGRWEGTTDSGTTEAVVVYRLTGRGTSLVETLLPGTPQEMMTIYHEDSSGELVATHCCIAGNQPEIRLVRASEGQFHFELSPDDQNVDEATELHGHELDIKLVGSDGLDLEWFNWDDGAPIGSRLYTFTRVN